MAAKPFELVKHCGNVLVRNYQTLKRKTRRQQQRCSILVPQRWRKPQPLKSRKHHQNLSNPDINRDLNSQSAFLNRLPLEIRCMIYSELFADPVHTYSDDLNHGYPRTVNVIAREAGRLIALPAKSSQKAFLPHRLALLKSCRQVYYEAVDIFYNVNTISIQSLDLLIDLAKTLLPQRLAAIRDLHFCATLQWAEVSIWWNNPKNKPDNAFIWSRVWKIVATQMPGLRHLSVNIHQFTWGEPNPLTEIRVLEPLFDLRGLKTFSLRYNHEPTVGFGYFPRMPQFNPLGDVCNDPEAIAFRKRLDDVVRKPRK